MSTRRGKSKSPWFKTHHIAATRRWRQCDECGIDVVRDPSTFRGDHVFCSQACHGQFKARQAQLDTTPAAN